MIRSSSLPHKRICSSSSEPVRNDWQVKAGQARLDPEHGSGTVDAEPSREGIRADSGFLKDFCVDWTWFCREQPVGAAVSKAEKKKKVICCVGFSRICRNSSHYTLNAISVSIQNGINISSAWKNICGIWCRKVKTSLKWPRLWRLPTPSNGAYFCQCLCCLGLN